MRKASSPGGWTRRRGANGSGCRRSGSARDREACGARLGIEEVVLELVRGVVLGLRGRLGSTDLEVLVAQRPARGRSSDLVALQLVQRPLGRLGEAADPCGPPASARLDVSPGSSLTGSPGSRPRSIPSSAAAITPPSAMYGFALVSLGFSLESWSSPPRRPSSGSGRGRRPRGSRCPTRRMPNSSNGV